MIISAETRADVGAQVCPMISFRGFTRQIALLVGKVVVYLSSFITAQQREFNAAVIQIFRKIADDIELIDNRDTFTRNSIQNLKAAVEDLKKWTRKGQDKRT
jgi:hypothetical protein